MKGVLRNCNSYQSDARDCARFADWYGAAGPNDNPKRFQALLLACASASHIRGGQRGCGYLGSAFSDLGNTDAAKAVFRSAPGCHADDDAGSPINDCLYPLTVVDNANPGSLFSRDELVAMGRLACEKENNPTGCQLANMKWDERAELQRIQNVNAEQDEEYAQAQKRAREHRESFNNVIDTVHGLTGSNSIQGTANQQTGAVRAQERAAQQRLADDKVPQAIQQAAANQNPPSTRQIGRAGGAERGSAPGPGNPVDVSGCVKVTVDAMQHLMTNTCHTVVNVVYAQPDSKEFGTMRISDFSLGYNESRWAGESRSDYKVYVCSSPFKPVKTGTDRTPDYNAGSTTCSAE
jgi:hypothetical protein